MSLRAATLLDLLTRLEEDMKRRAEESEGEPAEVKLPSLWRSEYTRHQLHGAADIPGETPPSLFW